MGTENNNDVISIKSQIIFLYELEACYHDFRAVLLELKAEWLYILMYVHKRKVYVHGLERLERDLGRAWKR